MTNRSETSLQHRVKPWAYSVFFAGLALAAAGQYLVGGQSGGPLILLGVLLIVISLVLAIIAYPWILGF
jgi:hypothetical protein